MLLTLFVDNRL